MLIFGSGIRSRLMGQGEFNCPTCRADTFYHHVSYRRWLKFFFFVPVAPLGEAQSEIICDRCRNRFGTGILGPAGSDLAPNPIMSKKAIFALLLAIFAFVSFCLNLMILPIGLASIVLAHLSLRDIRRSPVHMDGKGQAIAALAIGYPAVLLAGLFTYLLFFMDRPNANNANGGKPIAAAGVGGTAEAKLSAAESWIMSQRGNEVGNGNGPEAKDLAVAFAEQMKTAEEEFFSRTGKKPILQLSNGNFLTYCQLQEDTCLIISHVPSYRHYTNDAKEAIATIAWNVAHEIAAEKLKPGSRLAVGLRGTILYGDIMIGNISAADSAQTDYRKGKKEELNSFFAEPAKPQPPKDNGPPPEEPTAPSNPIPAEADATPRP